MADTPQNELPDGDVFGGTAVFVNRLERYLKSPLLTQTPLVFPEADRKNGSSVHPFQSLEKKTVILLGQSAHCINRLVIFPQDSGHRSELTGFHLKMIKKYQIALLFGICDEMENLLSLLRHIQKMTRVYQDHQATLSHAALLMKVIRERIANRPTSLLRINGDGQKIAQLNDTFQDVTDFEKTYEKTLHETAPPGNRGVERDDDLAQKTAVEIRAIRDRLKKNAGELKQGNTVLKKLAHGGYSPFMKRTLEALSARHEHRVRSFEKHLHEVRHTYYIADHSF